MLLADHYVFLKFAYLDQCHTSVVGLRELSNSFQVWKSENVIENLKSKCGGGLFTFPAMSNYSGEKFPMKNWIEEAHKSSYKVILDAASFVSTNPLDLSILDPDFVSISFYKIFGYPTGLGALIVKNSSLKCLKRPYFGGGTVEMHLVNKSGHAGKIAEEHFEDGTLHFHGILALKHGFDFIQKIGGMTIISQHTFNLAKYLFEKLSELKYDSGQKVIEIYTSNDFKDINVQGGILNFNVLKRNGSVFGFTEFRKIAIHNNLVIRVGCFCNIGSCQKYLNLTDKDIESNHKAGHVCGDNIDILGGKPTGSIRVSFGHYSTKSHADRVIKIIKDHFLNSLNITKEVSEFRSLTLKTVSASISNTLALVSSTSLKISKLYIYPIKSCGALKVSSGSWPMADTSLKYDRQFVIMQGRSTLTQRNQPLLCQICPKIDLESKVMRLSVSWLKETCQIALDQTSEFTKEKQLCSGKVCGDVIDGIDVSDEVSDWLELVTGLTGLRLIQVTQRNSKTKMGLQSLANEAQFLILNKTSAQELHDKSETLDAEQDVDWMIEQFRGNIVLEGGQAYEEDHWNQICITDKIIIDVIGPCTRCNIIGVNQVNAEKVQEPLESLAKMENRRFKFGLLAGSKTSMEGLEITVGNPVLITLKNE